MIIDKLLGKGTKSEVFYLRGFQRSGTNWVSNILNLHPEIACVGEYHLQSFFSAKNSILQARFNAFQRDKNFEKEFLNFVDGFVIRACKNKKLCGERTPNGLIGTYVPGRKNIIITRDGRDCIVSWYYHCLRRSILLNNRMKIKKEKFDLNPEYFEEHKNWLLSPLGYLSKLAKQWNDRVCNDIYQLNQADKGNLDMPYFWIKYEDLLADTEGIREEMYHFLGVNPDKAKKLNQNTTPGFSEHDPNSHNRIGIAGRWQEYFTQKQHNTFLEQAKEGLNLLGYSTDYTRKQST